MKQKHLKAYLNNARARAKRDNVPFKITLEDLQAIATDECPIFHSKFVWGASGLGKGKTHPGTPQLDKIQPELGYVVGNIAFISSKANKMKDNGTMQEHYDIADWIWNHLHAQENTATPIPAGHYPQSEEHTKHGTVLATGAGEDDYYPHHHCGTISREDLDHRAQESSGDSVAHRNKKVEPSPAFTHSQNNGEPEPEISRVELRGGRLFD